MPGVLSSIFTIFNFFGDKSREKAFCFQKWAPSEHQSRFFCDKYFFIIGDAFLPLHTKFQVFLRTFKMFQNLGVQVP